MYTTINGIDDKGKVTLEELPPSEKRMKVLVTFVDEEIEPITQRHHLSRPASR